MLVGSVHVAAGTGRRQGRSVSRGSGAGCWWGVEHCEPVVQRSPAAEAALLVHSAAVMQRNPTAIHNTTHALHTLHPKQLCSLTTKTYSSNTFIT